MDYLEYAIEDFLSDEGFCNYCLRKEQQDVAFWEEWLRLHPEKSTVVRQACELYFILNGNHTGDHFEKDLQAFEQSFDRHLAGAGYKHAGSRARQNARQNVRRYSPVLFAGLLVAVTLFITRRARRAPATTVLHGVVSASHSGEKRTLRLPDGTTVVLNSASRITVIGGFGDSLRQVNLEGEAYFDVARDPQHPFIIHTAAMDVHVLGTTVDVKAYPDDAVEETALISGSVEVVVKDGGNRRILLRPAEKIDIPNPAMVMPVVKRSIISQKQHVLSIEKLTVAPADSLPPEISWTMNCLSFTDKPLEEIAVQLERWYNVSIRFGDDDVKKYRYTATFDKKTIEQVLRALSISQTFTYTWEGEGKILIRSAPMKN